MQNIAFRYYLKHGIKIGECDAIRYSKATTFLQCWSHAPPGKMTRNMFHETCRSTYFGHYKIRIIQKHELQHQIINVYSNSAYKYEYNYENAYLLY